MSNSIVIEKVVKEGIGIKEAISRGLWKTGVNKYVQIDEINDPVYLKELLLKTCQNRLDKINRNYLNDFKNQLNFTIQIYDQLKTIDPEFKLEKNPIIKVCDDEKLEYFFRYFQNELEVSKEDILDNI